ncbi:MAG: hypothetical protein R8L53_10130 [Mariprofundales bacterium]
MYSIISNDFSIDILVNFRICMLFFAVNLMVLWLFGALHKVGKKTPHTNKNYYILALLIYTIGHLLIYIYEITEIILSIEIIVIYWLITVLIINWLSFDRSKDIAIYIIMVILEHILQQNMSLFEIENILLYFILLPALCALLYSGAFRKQKG